jgi:hypothetical protein
MPSSVTAFLFSEPSGRANALVQFAGALVFTGLYAYFTLGDGSTSSSWLLLLALGSVLSGIAESLPADRRRTAGVLRLSAMFVVLALLTTTVFAPRVVTG